MIIYSVKICVAKKISKTWYKWMGKKHIPDIMNTNLFVEFKLYENFEDNIRKKYLIQYKLENFEQYKKYEMKYQNNFQKEHSSKFKNKFLATRSLFIKIL